MSRLKRIINNFIQNSTFKNIKSDINRIIPFFKKSEINDSYSRRVKSTKSSAIREILKVIGKPGFISFAGGLPDEKLFPVKLLRKAIRKTMKNGKSAMFQYSLTEGYEPLRSFIIDNFYKKEGLTTDNVLITHGSQQGLDLISKVFIDPDDTVALSEPCYLGALQVFKASLAKIVTINTGKFKKASLEKLNKSNAKFLYVIPDFDNPTGNRMSIDTRMKIAESAKCLVVEDTAYRYLSFNGKTVPSIFEFDKKNNVIQLGSFSKIIAPGFRLGWICAPKDIISKLAATKQYTDLHTNTFGQSVIYEYLVHENWEGHVDIIRNRYKEKRDTLLNAIDKYLPDGYEVNEPLGGMFVWLKYKTRKIDFYDVLQKSIEKGVAFVPGSEFAVKQNLDNCVRLNYSYPEPDQIDKGIKILGNIIKSMP